MENNKIDKFKSLISKEESGWLKKAKYRKDNQEWLDVSFDIALNILRMLKENRMQNTSPKNQKELATAMDCSPQYINKLLKGSEKLNIETIVKIQNALNFKIINPTLTIREENEFVAKKESLYIRPIHSSYQEDYQRSGNLIKYNFRTNKRRKQEEEEYQTAFNG